MNFISRHFRPLILLSFAALPSMAHAQPAPSNTTIEIPQPQRAAKAGDRVLLPITWDELSAQIGGPTLVTLRVEKMAPLQIIEELQRQTAVPIEVHDPKSAYWGKLQDKRFSANYQAQPLWSVARDLARQMQIGLSASREGVEFVPYLLEKSALVANSGPGIFVLNEVNYQGLLGEILENARQPPARETLQFEGKIYLDPKISWQDDMLELQITEAIDENNQAVLQESPDAFDFSKHLNISWQPIDLKISLRPRTRQLKVLRGSVHGVVAVAAQTWEVADALNAKNVEKIIGEGEKSARLELQEVKKVGDDYRVVLVVSPRRSDPLALYRFLHLSTDKLIVIQNIFQDIRLLDNQGRALKKIKVDSQREGDKDTSIFTLTATFRLVESDAENQRTGAPAKLVLHYDADYRELVVPFEFKDIPLP